MKNTPIDELIKEYEAEECDFSDIDKVLNMTMLYVDRMPDCQVRCLLFVLAKHIAQES